MTLQLAFNPRRDIDGQEQRDEGSRFIHVTFFLLAFPLEGVRGPWGGAGFGRTRTY